MVALASGSDCASDPCTEDEHALSAAVSTTVSGSSESSMNSVNAETTGPTVTITTTASAPVNGPFTITISFSEPVTGLELDDLVVENGNASELEGTGSNYTTTITPTTSGTVTVDIPAGAAQNMAGTPSVAAAQFSITADLIPVPAPAVGRHGRPCEEHRPRPRQ